MVEQSESNSSVDVLLSEALENRNLQHAAFDALDQKAGVFLALAGVLVALGGTLDEAAYRLSAALLAVLIGGFAMAGLMVRKVPIRSPLRLWAKYRHSSGAHTADAVLKDLLRDSYALHVKIVDKGRLVDICMWLVCAGVLLLAVLAVVAGSPNGAATHG